MSHQFQMVALAAEVIQNYLEHIENTNLLDTQNFLCFKYIVSYEWSMLKRCVIEVLFLQRAQNIPGQSELVHFKRQRRSLGQSGHFERQPIRGLIENAHMRNVKHRR